MRAGVQRQRWSQVLNADITALEKELSAAEQNRSIGADELRRREVVVIDLIRCVLRQRRPVFPHPCPPRPPAPARHERAYSAHSHVARARAPCSFRDRLDVLAANPNKKDRSVRFSDSVTTIRLDDTTSLVELQRAQLEQQDRHLDALADSVGKTKDIAVSISEELDAQAALVDELDTKVDRSRTKMAYATTSVDRAVRSLKRDRSTQMVCVLVVVIVVAIILIVVLKTAL